MVRHITTGAATMSRHTTPAKKRSPATPATLTTIYTLVKKLDATTLDRRLFITIIIWMARGSFR